jgi:hypothetical protein
LPGFDPLREFQADGGQRRPESGEPSLASTLALLLDGRLGPVHSGPAPVETGPRAGPGGYVGTVSTDPTPVPTPLEVRQAYQEELEPRERSILWSWIGFTTTFVVVRGITYSIRRGGGPFRNLSVGGEHLHHYMWGIGLVSVVGAVAVAGSERELRHPMTGVAYGSGLALIVDEFALLLDLKDVYWAKQGRLSLDLGVGMVALGGTALRLSPVVARLLRNRGITATWSARRR